MLASLQALEARHLEEGFAPFESGTMRGGQQPARHIELSINGARDMYLFVTGCPDVKWGVADWADARLIGKDGSVTSLSDSKNFKVLRGRHELNLTLRSGLYQKMRLPGREFDRGLNVQADSVIRVPLDGEYERFETWIGVDDWAGTNGTVRFSVLGARAAARKRLFEWVARDFPEGPQRQQMNWEREDRIYEFDWTPGDWIALAQRYAQACDRVPPLATAAARLASRVVDQVGMEQTRELYYRSRQLDASLVRASSFDFEGLRLAISDLTKTYGENYPRGSEYLKRLDQLEKSIESALATLEPRSSGRESAHSSPVRNAGIAQPNAHIEPHGNGLTIPHRLRISRHPLCRP